VSAPRESSGVGAAPGPISEVILASAGTGKTHALTGRYISILLAQLRASERQAVDPARVLATTFTRKAAGEILQRVLSRLAHAAARDDKLLALGASLDDAPGVAAQSAEPRLTRSDCLALLRGTASGLHRTAVMTIDALLFRVATSFAMELGVAPGWRLIDDEEDAELRREALSVAMRDADERDLCALVDMLASGTATGRVASRIERAINPAYDAFMSTGGRAQAWSLFAPQREPLDPDAIVRAIEALAVAPPPMNKSRKPDQRFVKAHDAAVDHARQTDWNALLASGLAQSLLTGRETYYAVPVPSEISEPLRTIVEHAGAVVLERYHQRNIATGALLARFHRAYAALKLARGTLRFDDVPRLLLGQLALDDAQIDGPLLADDARLDDLAFRLDSAIDHVLLDEFQDTSGEQFRLLRPLLSEVLAQVGPDGRWYAAPGASRPRSTFIVGDIKQSLYTWRHAEPELLASLAGVPTTNATARPWSQLAVRQLSESWRSSPVVLATVNRVFGGLDANAALSALPGADEVRARWRAEFRAHTAAAPLRALPGAARLWIAPEPAPVEGHKPTQSDRVRSALDFGAQRVRALLDEAGPRAMSVGVLLRSRKHLAPTLLALRELGVPASLEGGTLLTDAPVVAAVVSLLHLALHPGDTMSFFHLQHSCLSDALGLSPTTPRSSARLFASRWRRRLSDHGLGASLHALLVRAAPRLDQRNLDRFKQLVELAQEADEHPGTSVEPISALLAIIRSRQVREPTPSAVRVMTIHASKGLEFDAVVLPDLESRWEVRHSSVLLARGDALAAPFGAGWAPSELLRQLDPRLAALHAGELSRTINEGLCALYVAMTRARAVLEMVLAPQSASSEDGTPKSTSASRVLRAALSAQLREDQPAPAASTLAWAAEREGQATGPWTAALRDVAPPPSDAPAPRATPSSKAEHPGAPIGALRLRPAAHTPTGRLTRVSPSGLEGTNDDAARTDDDTPLDTRLDAPRDATDLLPHHAEHDDASPGGAGVPATSALGSPDPSSRIRGVVVHALFERLTWSDDPLPSRDELLSIAARAGADAQAGATLVDDFLALLGRDGPIARALRRSSYPVGPALSLWRERRFVVRLQEPPALMSGTFDRVVVARTPSGVPMWAHVLDFKTDAVGLAGGISDPRLIERVEHYRPQIEAYCRAVATMLRLDVRRVGAALLFTQADLRVELAPLP
jgi:ATP-dependent helicase/nuclease subunit A